MDDKNNDIIVPKAHINRETNTCGVCYKQSVDCFDKLCTACEPEFFNSLDYCSRTMSVDTTLKNLATAAGNLTRTRLLLRSSKEQEGSLIENKTLST